MSGDQSDQNPDQQPGEKPEPEIDVPPPGPGAPSDRPATEQHQFPVATPDQPRSAQVEGEEVPDEIEEPEDTAQEGEGDATDEPSG